MKCEKAATCHIEDDELSNDDVPIGPGRNRQIRRTKREEQEPLRNNFTIKNIEGSLSRDTVESRDKFTILYIYMVSYFIGDDKLPKIRLRSSRTRAPYSSGMIYRN